MTVGTGPGDDAINEGLEEVLDEKIRLGMATMFVGAPARVVSYDAATQKVSVQLVLRARIKGQTNAEKFPVIPNVPVRFPSGGDFSMTMPLSVGDFVWVDFSDRSLDEWLNTGQADVTPQSRRRFNISDAVAYPGIRAFAAALSNASTTELVIGQDEYNGPITNNGSIVAPLQLRIGPDGMRLGDGGSVNDVLAILSGFLQLLAVDANVTLATRNGAAALDLLLDGIRNP